MPLGCESVEVDLALEGSLKPDTPPRQPFAQLRTERQAAGIERCAIVIPQASAAIVRHHAGLAERFRSHGPTYPRPPAVIASTHREAGGFRPDVGPAPVAGFGVFTGWSFSVRGQPARIDSPYVSKIASDNFRLGSPEALGIRQRLGRQPGTERQGHCSPEGHTADSLRLRGLPGRLDEPIQRIRERPERERRWLSSEVWQKGTESRVSDPRLVVTSLSAAARYLYETIYCAQGEMENRIKLYRATPPPRGAMSRVLKSPAAESEMRSSPVSRRSPDLAIAIRISAEPKGELSSATGIERWNLPLCSEWRKLLPSRLGL